MKEEKLKQARRNCKLHTSIIHVFSFQNEVKQKFVH